MKSLHSGSVSSFIRKILLRVCFASILAAAAMGCTKNGGTVSGLSTTTSPTLAPPVLITQVSPTLGPFSTLVLITGNGFDTAAKNDAVFFNGTAAIVISVTPTQMAVAVPKKAGTGPVTVTVAGHQTATGPIFNYVYTPVVSTLAGTGTGGFMDGSGLTAEFNGPVGLILDRDNNLIVADALNNRIRQFIFPGAGIPNGVVSTIAGTGGAGWLDGAGSGAEFNLPSGLVIDTSTGNIYVADTRNNLIRQLATQGKDVYSVTTLAGSLPPGNMDGMANYAQFNSPIGMGIDFSKTLFIADAGNNKIRSYSGGTTASVGTFWGDGTTAVLNHPTGIVQDNTDDYNIVDKLNNRIIRINTFGPGGKSSFIQIGTGAAGHVDGDWTVAEFNQPSAIAVGPEIVGTLGSYTGPLLGSSNLYIADAMNHCIRQLTPGGTPSSNGVSSYIVSTMAGTGVAGYADGVGSVAQFNNPSGIVVDAQGNVYVADTGNNRIRMISQE